MSRAIDADHLKRWIISRGLKSQLHPADIIDQIDRESTIEPHCETCEAFNKTRLLIPQRKKGKWLYDEERCATGIYAICSACDESIYQTGNFRYCPNCGADMREEGEK